jgi:hypothetical protein
MLLRLEHLIKILEKLLVYIFFNLLNLFENRTQSLIIFTVILYTSFIGIWNVMLLLWICVVIEGL